MPREAKPLSAVCLGASEVISEKVKLGNRTLAEQGHLHFAGVFRGGRWAETHKVGRQQNREAESVPNMDSAHFILCFFPLKIEKRKREHL